MLARGKMGGSRHAAVQDLLSLSFLLLCRILSILYQQVSISISKSKCCFTLKHSLLGVLRTLDAFIAGSMLMPRYVSRYLFFSRSFLSNQLLRFLQLGRTHSSYVRCRRRQVSMCVYVCLVTQWVFSDRPVRGARLCVFFLRSGGLSSDINPFILCYGVTYTLVWVRGS